MFRLGDDDRQASSKLDCEDPPVAARICQMVDFTYRRDAGPTSITWHMNARVISDARYIVEPALRTWVSFRRGNASSHGVGRMAVSKPIRTARINARSKIVKHPPRQPNRFFNCSSLCLGPFDDALDSRCRPPLGRLHHPPDMKCTF